MLTATVGERPETRLTLHIQQEEEGQVDSTTLVRWCVTQEFVDDLRVRKFTRPYLVLVIRKPVTITRDGDTFTEYRQVGLYVEALGKEARYITFKSPGEHEIRAVVVNAPTMTKRKRLWSCEGSAIPVFVNVDKPAANNEQSDGDEEHETVEEFVLVVDKTALCRLDYVKLETCLEVEVPKEMFAKEYPDWIRKIVRRFYPKPDKDQCQFKWRAIYCIGWVAAILTFGQIVKAFCALAGVFFGIRSDRWRDVIKPIQGSLAGPFKNPESSIWFEKKDGELRTGNPIMLFNPVVAFLPAGVTFGLMQAWAAICSNHNHAGVGYPGWWDTLWMADLATVCLLAAVTIVLVAIAGVNFVLDRNKGIKNGFTWVVKKYDSLTDSVVAWFEYRYHRKLGELVCDDKLQVVSYEDIPRNRRSIKLRYQNTKAKHCKPFAQ